MNKKEFIKAIKEADLDQLHIMYRYISRELTDRILEKGDNLEWD